MKKIAFVLPFLFSILLVSCQSEVSLHVNANKILNPDFHKNMSEPVSIHVYQLKDPKKFNEANYFQITDDPDKTLGADFLSPMTSFMVSPNQKREFSVKLNSDTKYFGLIAAFQSIDNSKWKVVVPLEGNHKKNITIHLKDRSLTIKED